ncbi:ABC transporter ATP-binding protein [bacterium]|nr:ABC transporter ATP-binding protein [bacterium]
MLKIKNLSVKYISTNTKVIKNISFDVKKGEVIAILGSSGCGKTTLLNVVQGLLDNDVAYITGEVLIQKETRVNTVFQEPRLLPWKNVLKNIVYAIESKNIDTKKASVLATEILKKVKLNDYTEYLPAQLSLGMQQRVNFARAIVCSPDLLLMDEPFSALDSKTKNEIIKEFKKIISENKLTTIFVTHDIKEALNLATRVFVMDYEFKEVKKDQIISDFIKEANSFRGAS